MPTPLKRESKISGIIDSHEHYRKGGNISAFFSAMKVLKISKVVFVPTGSPPNNRGYKGHMAELLKLQKKFPDKIIAFCTINEKDPQAFEVFENCIKKGGQGLKLIGGHPQFYRPPLNSPCLYKVLDRVQKYQLPVLIHVSPITLPRAAREFEKIIRKYPKITFIWAHFCSCIYQGINLEKAQYYLDRYPNLYTDISMGGGIKRYFKYLQINPKKIRDFVIRYQDKILWGADLILDTKEYKNQDWLVERISCDFKLHQKKFFKCKFVRDPKLLINGLFLPKKILKKIYVINPKKILRI
ncbi:MAG: amidohydrolase family protein [Patescibacteria group bacterium]|nr:amidohydrolase family protein [Patescibacteria group bacterium]